MTLRVSTWNIYINSKVKHDSDRFLFMYVHGNGRCLQQVPSEAEVSPSWTWVWAPCSLVQDGATLHLCVEEHWEERSESLIEDAPPPAEEEWSGRTPQCPAAAGVWGWPWTGSEGHLHARLEEQRNVRFVCSAHAISKVCLCLRETTFSRWKLTQMNFCDLHLSV